MGRARGSGSKLHGKFETVYGTPPTGNFIRLPFVSSNIGPEQGLIESDLLGQGREGFDPTLDVVNNDGDVVVPVDVRNFGHWLKLLTGAPATAPNRRCLITPSRPARRRCPACRWKWRCPKCPASK
jgi:hypothetical protein